MTSAVPDRRRDGFTLVEMVIGVTILAVIARLLVGASEASSSMTELGNIEGEVFRQGERALGSILDDLRRSGYVTVDGKAYPHLYDAGVAGPGFEAYAYQPGPQAAVATDPDFGVVRSIVLCLPSDLDNDGRPELDADGDGTPELDADGDGTPTDDPTDVGGLWDPFENTIHPDTRVVWSHQDVGYVVTATGPGGENELVRLVDGGAGGRKVLARHVERVQFDTPATAGFTIPGGTVRVRIFFRVPDSQGRVYRSRTEATVRLRNG